jgi:hypothetical protein
MCAAIFCNLACGPDDVEVVEVDLEGLDVFARNAAAVLCLPAIIGTLYYRYQVIYQVIKNGLGLVWYSNSRKRDRKIPGNRKTIWRTIFVQMVYKKEKN